MGLFGALKRNNAQYKAKENSIDNLCNLPLVKGKVKPYPTMNLLYFKGYITLIIIQQAEAVDRQHKW